MTPEKFHEEIISDYQKKKAQGLLPKEVEYPTSAKLMRHCLILFHEGQLKNDLSILTKIFNSENKYDDLVIAIRKFGVDKFRPLRNFIVGITDRPSENVMNLLAILIDFQPRPYEKWREIRYAEADGLSAGIQVEESPNKPTSGNEKDSDNLKEETVNGKPPEEPPSNGEEQTKNSKPTPKIRIITLFVIVAAAACLGTFTLFNKQCMYWTGDRYVPIACHQKIEGAEIIPLDKHLAVNMRKITQPDTLKKNALDNVWYIKISVDSTEFYTSAGFYPLDRTKKLRPVTEYILNKYVLGK